MSRLPRVCRAFIAIELTQGVLLLALNHTRLVPAGAAFALLLLWGLARGSMLCWVLLLVENAFGFIAPLGLIAAGGNVIWANAAALIVPCLAQIVLLLTRSMRAHVGIARPPSGVLL